MKIMKLPIFEEFKKDFNPEKLCYDIEKNAPGSLLGPNKSFTKEQYLFLCETVAAMSLSLLQQYHEWLCEKLSS